MQKQADALRANADVYVINSDTPDASHKLREITGISLSVLLDRDLSVAKSYDMLPKRGQPMGSMAGVAQMGFVVIDATGTIRAQRADINFGEHADQILKMLAVIDQP